jgi:hypothetical protein
MSTKVKGMVQLEGLTYRIVRVAQGSYNVVRIHDDSDVGSFRTGPGLPVEPRQIEPAVLMQIARMAIQSAKTSVPKFARVEPPKTPLPVPELRRETRDR